MIRLRFTVRDLICERLRPYRASKDLGARLSVDFTERPGAAVVGIGYAAEIENELS
jgi:hypothetical protein